MNGAIIIQNIGNAFLSAGVINSSMPTYGVFLSAINTIYAADTWTVLLYFGLWVIAILAAAFLESETLNLPLTIFMGFAVVIVSFIISNAAHAVLGNPIYANVISHFGNTQLSLANLGALTLIFVFVYALVILARPLYSGGGVSRSSTIVVSP